jgi:hypothetical protein
VLCKSQMPTLQIPNDASIHTIRNFLSKNSPFSVEDNCAKLIFHPKWAYMDPLALVMTAAWGKWCRCRGWEIEVENCGQHVNYPVRMQLFKLLDVPFTPDLHEHEPSGRFMPLKQVNSASDLDAVMADISALLHLEQEPDGLAAVRYCVSELIRNVLEHSGSTDGAFVCAQRYVDADPKRVSIAVADCGGGIADHLGDIYPEAREDHREALRLAMTPGVTGARPGIYGTTDNAGAGLFITRAIARATGGYFVLASGNASFRIRREKQRDQRVVFHDAYLDPKHNEWILHNPWHGTVAAVEIATDEIPDFHQFFQWVRSQLPTKKKTAAEKIKFT